MNNEKIKDDKRKLVRLKIKQRRKRKIRTEKVVHEMEKQDEAYKRIEE